MDIKMIKISNLENEIKQLKEQKNKIDELINKITINNNNFEKSNLSGKTFTKAIEANKLLLDNLKKRENEMNSLISKLEASQTIYNDCALSIAKSIYGGSNEL